jgi:hypothetical protein
MREFPAAQIMAPSAIPMPRPAIAPMTLTTDRLILRPWRDQDREPFVMMAESEEVMRHLRPLPTKEACNRWIDHQVKHEIAHGFCLWAADLKVSSTFIGAVGLLNTSFMAHFTPAIEVGWRLAHRYWGHGYAPQSRAGSFGFCLPSSKRTRGCRPHWCAKSPKPPCDGEARDVS